MARAAATSGADDASMGCTARPTCSETAASAAAPASMARTAVVGEVAGQHGCTPNQRLVDVGGLGHGGRDDALERTLAQFLQHDPAQECLLRRGGARPQVHELLVPGGH